MDLLATTGRTSIKKKSESLDATKTSSNNLALSYFIPPWPEWIDAEINADRWDANVGFPARSKEKNKAFSVNNISFEDPCGHGFLPEGIVAYNWKRITTFTFKDDLIVKPIEHDNNLTYPDLISSNHHILHNSLMRWIVCSVMNLYHLAEKDPFPVEGECPNFFPTGGRVWKPWHHVYSMCKVGKGQGHKSTVNPFGKYIVRLYFMGTWRRITVDDYIPVDQNNRILLPTCDKPYEIWPMILTKALLKIASLVWGHGNNETDFNVVTCLTGWMDHVIDCTKIPIKYSWLMIQKLLMADNEDPEKRYKGFVDNKDLILDNICNSNYVNDEEDSQTEIIGKVAIFGVIHDLTEQIEILEGISPCLSHPVLISEARDLTHGYHPERPKTPRWKQYRWKAWAVKKGLVEDIHTKQQKSVSVYSVMKKFKAESVPFWCVQVVIDSDKFSTVSLDLDQRHEEGFRSLKSTWEKEEPGRQKRSMQIRNDFIKHLEEDDTYRLFNDSKIDVSKKSNLEYLMVSYHKLDDDINNVIVLNDEIQTRLMHKHVDEVLKAHEISETFRERLNIESKTQGKRHMLMLRHQEKCHEESKRLMLEAYTLLDNITNKMKALQEKNEFSKNKVKTSLKDKSKEKTSHQTKEK
uniref:Calpain catalytic domain-containing protein n=1 Tax=Timema cristinae TaxID=61476 RepID=A0A7R9CDB6_TIMCR|nr:unnamed protein product [Timema cristinae]